MASREERLAQNEIVFREVNERIKELTESWPGDLDLVCECADNSCLAVVHLSRPAYEELRQNPHRFVVVPGHEQPDIETVVERHPSHLIVEKHGETHEQVEEADPRK